MLGQRKADAGATQAEHEQKYRSNHPSWLNAVMRK
jgi:hypothetical protein